MRTFILLAALAIVFINCETARLETCSGWRLNRLPKVKAFINDHAEFYENFEIKYIGGANPELVFDKEDGSDAERIAVDQMETQEICDVLEKRGYVKKTKEEEVPEPPRDEF